MKPSMKWCVFFIVCVCSFKITKWYNHLIWILNFTIYSWSTVLNKCAYVHLLTHTHSHICNNVLSNLWPARSHSNLVICISLLHRKLPEEKEERKEMKTISNTHTTNHSIGVCVNCPMFIDRQCTDWEYIGRNKFASFARLFVCVHNVFATVKLFDCVVHTHTHTRRFAYANPKQTGNIQIECKGNENWTKEI